MRSRLTRNEVGRGASCCGMWQLGAKVGSVWMDGVFCMENVNENDAKRRGPGWAPVSLWFVSTPKPKARRDGSERQRLVCMRDKNDESSPSGKNAEQVGQQFLQKQAEEM